MTVEGGMLPEASFCITPLWRNLDNKLLNVPLKQVGILLC